MKGLAVPLVLALLLATGCGSLTSDTLEQLEEELPPRAEVKLESSDRVVYYFDKIHQVGIWIFYGYKRGGLAVLPRDQFANPEVIELELR